MKNAKYKCEIQMRNSGQNPVQYCRSSMTGAVPAGPYDSAARFLQGRSAIKAAVILFAHFWIMTAARRAEARG
jgi:hypothetical protein